MTTLTDNQKHLFKTLAVHSDGVERGIHIRDITNPVDLNIRSLNVKEISDFTGFHPVAIRGLIHNLETKGLIIVIKNPRRGNTNVTFTDAGYELVKKYFQPL